VDSWYEEQEVGYYDEAGEWVYGMYDDQGYFVHGYCNEWGEWVGGYHNTASDWVFGSFNDEGAWVTPADVSADVDVCASDVDERSILETDQAVIESTLAQLTARVEAEHKEAQGSAAIDTAIDGPASALPVESAPTMDFMKGRPEPIVGVRRTKRAGSTFVPNRSRSQPPAFLRQTIGFELEGGSGSEGDSEDDDGTDEASVELLEELDLERSNCFDVDGNVSGGSFGIGSDAERGLQMGLQMGQEQGQGWGQGLSLSLAEQLSLEIEQRGEMCENLVVRAIADYTAVDDSELSVLENDLINVHVKDASGWWHGECQGLEVR
jgi:hypothetical protein